ncbi:hypothetical protein TRAPUB_7642 [Trametes pubescens]|uniref:Uncharacterized protein n=1 Tax=Trametes pubescens TaxID=154538 RepID=A0A1M2V2V7_TRAPU|nr:hypothetical protein TRAPUB_7642 [Trametes pubescens]
MASSSIWAVDKAPTLHLRGCSLPAGGRSDKLLHSYTLHLSHLVSGKDPVYE